LLSRFVRMHRGYTRALGGVTEVAPFARLHTQASAGAIVA